MSESEIKAAFRQFDTDGNGLIDCEELGAVLKDLDPQTWTDQRINSLMRLADRDRNGLLDYSEFSEWIAVTGPTSDLLKVNEKASTITLTTAGGSTFEVDVEDCNTIGDLKEKAAALLDGRSDTILQLMAGARVVQDDTLLSELRSNNLTVTFLVPELSYRADAGGGNVKLICEGDRGYSKADAEKAQVKMDSWVQPPRSDMVNFASERYGAKVTSSSNIWGDSAVAQEKLLNVIRLGSLQGDPRFVGGDSSFIFRERDRSQVLEVELGSVTTVHRIGTMCYGDRWLDYLQVSTKEDEGDPWTEWGRERTSYRRGGAPYFDREPTKVKFIRFNVSSGHYYGAGTRLGPIFAYGVEEAPVAGATGETNDPSAWETNDPSAWETNETNEM